MCICISMEQIIYLQRDIGHLVDGDGGGADGLQVDALEKHKFNIIRTKILLHSVDQRENLDNRQNAFIKEIYNEVILSQKGFETSELSQC